VIQVLEPEESVSALPSDGGSAEVVTSPDWKVRLWNWLEHAGKRVGVPVLVLSSLSLCIAIASLCIGVANYRFNVSADRPVLDSTGLNLTLQARTPIEIGFNNVGKKTARRGTAVLLAINNEGESPEEIGSSPIVGAGTNIFAGYGSKATFYPQAIQPAASFLVCSTYFDEAGTKYEQAFLFGRDPIPVSGATASQPSNPVVIRYDEQAPPDPKKCDSTAK
jgi:hypothetical protein